MDGTDCRIPERGPPWYSHKFKKSAVRYEVAVGIKTGDICWFSGPHMAGRMNDVEIFRKSLRTYLDPFECVEADDGYFKKHQPRSYAQSASPAHKRGRG